MSNVKYNHIREEIHRKLFNDTDYPIREFKDMRVFMDIDNLIIRMRSKVCLYVDIQAFIPVHRIVCLQIQKKTS